MNAAEFARRRGRIEHQAGRKHSWRVKAMRQLVNDAHAILVVAGGKIVGWHLPSGETVCMKQRFRDEGAATFQLGQIARTDGARLKRPVRAYACQFCGGWHLTSKVIPSDPA